MITLERIYLIKVMITQLMFTRLSLFQKKLSINCSRFKQKQKLIQKQFNKLILLNLTRAECARIYFTIEEANETVLDFSKVTVKVL